MKRLLIIFKKFFELFDLTQKERILLLNELMREWNIKTEELSTPLDRRTSASSFNDFDEDPENSALQQKQQPSVITFTEEDARLTDQPEETSKETEHSDKDGQVFQNNNISSEDILPQNAPDEEIKTEIEAAEQEPAPTETETSPVKRRKRRTKAEIEAAKQALATTEAETSPVKRRKRRTKAEIEAAKQALAATAAETPPVKRRGRPKKNKEEPRLKKTSFFSETDEPEEELSSSFDDENIIPENPSSEDENLIEEVATTRDLRSLLEDEPPVRSKATQRRNPAFCYLADYPALIEQKIGIEYSFEFLYQWDDRNLLSAFVLPDKMPIGIYIPYKKPLFGKYRGFIISIYDEHVITDAQEAINDVQTKMKKIDNEPWSVMNAIQFSIVKSVSETVNRMLSKVGGDRLGSTYKLLSPKSNHVTGIGRFRYAIDVK